jgi:hypothetical protein
LWAATIGLFLGMTLGGWIVERFRSQRVTCVTICCLGVATVLTVASASRLSLVLALVPFGFLNGLTDVSMNSQAAAFEQRTHSASFVVAGSPPRDLLCKSSSFFLQRASFEPREPRTRNLELANWHRARDISRGIFPLPRKMRTGFPHFGTRGLRLAGPCILQRPRACSGHQRSDSIRQC